jgi:heptosyltransferase-2
MSGPSEAPRTLVVHARSGIGDLVWHVPYIRALAAASAGGRVSVMARPSCRARELLAAEPVEAIIDCDWRPRASERRAGRHESWAGQWRLIRQLRQGRFDRVCIFSGHLRYALWCALAGIPRRHGFGFSAAQRSLLNAPPYIAPHRGPGNWVYPEASAFAVAQAWVAAPVLPRLAVLDTATQAAAQQLRGLPPLRVALAIGASEPRKQWGAERFGALAAALASQQIGVILLGGPGEAALAAEILGRLPYTLAARVRSFAQPSIQLTAGLLQQCRLCVGNDTGALNLSVAVETPALGLFGATPPLRHDPRLSGLEGRGMEGIHPNAVLDALRSRLETPAERDPALS